MATSAVPGVRHMDAAFELPTELEKRLHESLLVDVRREQRTQLRPGVNRKSGAALDVLTGDRTKKKISRAISVLQDDYGVSEDLVREALAYANTWEDALTFLALQLPSDELPAKLRAKPDRTTDDSKGDDDDGELLAVVAAPLAAPVVEPETASLEQTYERIQQAAEPVENWDDENDEGIDAVVPASPEAPLEPATEVVEIKQGAQEAMSWTQRYILQLEAEEAREKELEKLEAAMTPEERELRDGEMQYTALNDRMQQQKASGKLTKKKQKAMLQDIQLLRMQLVRLGWREAEYRQKQQALRGETDDQTKIKPKKEKEALEGSVGKLPSTGDGEVDDRLFHPRDGRQSRLGFRDDEGNGEAPPSSTNAKSREVDSEEENYSGGLFDPPAASTPATPPVPPTTEEAPSEIALQPGGRILANFPPTLGSWTGKTPRDLLQDYCQKHKLQRPQYKKLSTRGAHLYTITLDKKGAPRQEFGAADDDQLFTTRNGFRTIDEAKDAIATVALYALTPQLPLYGLMPPAFRALWLEWERAKQARATASVDAETHAFDAFVDDVFQCIPDEIKTKTPTIVATPVATPSLVKETESTKEPSLDAWDVDDWETDLPDADDAAATSGVAADDAPPLQEEPPVDAEHVAAHARISKDVRDAFLRNTRSEQYRKLLPRRNNLPIATFRDTVLAALNTHHVILISGETGCGKSTQVPQYLLEDMVATQSRGARCQIVCTQPRRLAATSLAERVSLELGEKTMAQGDSLCGFQIRLENRMTKHTRLLFCTTGILLRKLQEATTLEDELSHIIVDEVHERDVQNDVLLSMLRTFLETKNKLRKQPLKVILMSATLNAASFQQYFGGATLCPMLTVPGRTFPVEEFYLEDAVEATQFVVDEASPSYRRCDDASATQSTKVTISGRGGTSHTQRVTWRDASGPQGGRHQSVGGGGGGNEEEGYSERTLMTLDRLDESVINYELIEQLIEHLVTATDLLRLDTAHATHASASILVFMPGLQEISNLLDVLSGNRYLRDTTKFELLPLHSSLSPDDQRRIFAMRRGIVRVIATTNIAETSLTIEDVKVVIDSGRAKEMRHDSTTKTNLLEEIWISRANAKQRLGRAGRTSGGTCYRLFSRATFAHAMPAQPLPEIQRAPLTSLCLQIKTFGVASSCAHFLENCLDPPEAASVHDALRELYEIGALEVRDDASDTDGNTTTEQLTTLGRHLAQLPVDVRVGKLLLLGAIFNAFDAVSTCAAILETKSPFVAPYGYQKEMQAARQHFAIGHSDLLTDTNAFNAWRQRFQVDRTARRHDEKAFCRQYFLSSRSLLEIVKLKKQFAGIVTQLGFLSGPSTPPPTPLTVTSCALIAALLYGGLEPNVMYVDPALSSAHRVGLRAESDRGTARAFVHPGSINAKTTTFPSPFLAYAVKLHTSQVYVPSSSMVLPSALCVFSYAMEIVFPHRGTSSGDINVKLNDWIVLKSSLRSAVLLYELRRLVQEFVDHQIKSPPFQSPTPNAQVDATKTVVLEALTHLFYSEYDVRDSKHVLTKQLNPPLK